MCGLERLKTLIVWLTLSNFALKIKTMKTTVKNNIRSI